MDLRSDTVTHPSQDMIKTASSAPLGDDVMGEDPTVVKLEMLMADKFGKEKGLFVPTGTMANLVALMSHCDKAGRAPEIITGALSHINLYEGGNASSLGGIHTRQINEDACIIYFTRTRLQVVRKLHLYPLINRLPHVIA